MNAIVTIPPPSLAYAEMERLAEAIAKSNLFGIRTKEQAIVLMAIAQAEGRHPALAARDYDIVNNRPAKKAEAMMRDFVAAGGTVKWHSLTDELADATFTHPQTGSVRIDWDMQRAQTAFGKKDMYTKFPRQMLRSRVVSEGVRTLWPLATSGMYEPGEAADIQPEHNGPTIESTAADVQAAAYEAPLESTPAPRPPKAPAVARSDAAWRGWLDKLRDACAVLYHRSEVVEVAERPSVADALATGPAWVQREISSILADNYKRFTDEPEAEELPEVVIAGEEKLAAGD